MRLPWALHARIAETLESQFAEIAEKTSPELLARQCTEAGLTEKRPRAFGAKAAQRSVERSALALAPGLPLPR